MHRDCMRLRPGPVNLLRRRRLDRTYVHVRTNHALPQTLLQRHAGPPPAFSGNNKHTACGGREGVDKRNPRKERWRNKPREGEGKKTKKPRVTPFFFRQSKRNLRDSNGMEEGDRARSFARSQLAYSHTPAAGFLRDWRRLTTTPPATGCREQM